MVKHTTTSLIELLSKFPKNLPIETELALMWNYPEELLEGQDRNSKEFFDLSIENATDLCIFEGSWDKGNVSDVDGKYKEFFKVIQDDINEKQS